MKSVYVLHTGFALVEPLKPLFQELLPEVRILTLVDDSLLADVRAAGALTPSVVRRMVGYGILAESAGVDAILSCCSSVGDAAALMQQAVGIPVVRIDQAMAEQAVAAGSKIGIIATLATTLAPTERLVQGCAAQAGRQIATARHLAEGAFDALMAGDAAGHDRLLEAEILRAAESCDVVVLAQGSMARLVPQLQPRLQVPLLSSLRSGVGQLKAALEAKP